MKKDDIKTLIVVLIVCLICGVIVFLVSRKSNTEKLTGVTEYNTFFSVINSVNEYINYISDNDAVGVYSLLYDDYISKKEIDKNSIFDYIPKFSVDESFKVTSMEASKVSDNYYLYYVKGKIIKNSYDSTSIINDDYEILVINDYNNLTKAIYPIVNGDNTEKIINSIKKKNIVKNDYNAIKGTGIIKKEQICSLYLSDYLNYLYNDVNRAYDLLSDDMKKRYTTMNTFNKFINNNDKLISFTADKCYTSSTSKGRFYSVIDKNGNTFNFNEENIMDYTVDIKFNSEESD